MQIKNGKKITSLGQKGRTKYLYISKFLLLHQSWVMRWWLFSETALFRQQILCRTFWKAKVNIKNILYVFYHHNKNTLEITSFSIKIRILLHNRILQINFTKWFPFSNHSQDHRILSLFHFSSLPFSLIMICSPPSASPITFLNASQNYAFNPDLSLEHQSTIFNCL